MNITQYQHCSTSGLKSLDLQLIAQIQRIAPGSLARFDYLPIKLGAGCHPFLQPPAIAALELALTSRPGAILQINSAYRTIAQQAVLWTHRQNRRCGILAAALPGNSNHNTGLSIDVDFATTWRPYLERYRWDWLGSFDPMHFDFEGSGTKDLRFLSIKAFQQLWNLNHPQQKLVEDGIWGMKTSRALMVTAISGFMEVPDRAAVAALGNINTKSSIIVSDAIGIPSLRSGDRGSAVVALQQRLQQLGYKLRADGIYGIKTAESIKVFQHQKGLIADGVAGTATRKALGIG